MIHFLDFEASSLDQASYPIEAGWATLDLETGEITSEAMLILPISTWTDWNAKSQSIHGIERSTLLQEGYTAKAVAQRMSMVLTGPVFCDGGEYDVNWNHRLFDAAGMSVPFAILNYWRAVEQRQDDYGVSGAAQFEAYQRFRAPRPHRAEADARFLAELYRDCLTF